MLSAELVGTDTTFIFIVMGLRVLELDEVASPIRPKYTPAAPMTLGLYSILSWMLVSPRCRHPQEARDPSLSLKVRLSRSSHLRVSLISLISFCPNLMGPSWL